MWGLHGQNCLQLTFMLSGTVKTLGNNLIICWPLCNGLTDFWFLMVNWRIPVNLVSIKDLLLFIDFPCLELKDWAHKQKMAISLPWVFRLWGVLLEFYPGQKTIVWGFWNLLFNQSPRQKKPMTVLFSEAANKQSQRRKGNQSTGISQRYCTFSSRPLQKANITIKWVTQIFWFRSAYKKLCLYYVVV